MEELPVWAQGGLDLGEDAASPDFVQCLHLRELKARPSATSCVLLCPLVGQRALGSSLQPVQLGFLLQCLGLLPALLLLLVLLLVSNQVKHVALLEGDEVLLEGRLLLVEELLEDEDLVIEAGESPLEAALLLHVLALRVVQVPAVFSEAPEMLTSQMTPPPLELPLSAQAAIASLRPWVAVVIVEPVDHVFPDDAFLALLLEELVDFVVDGRLQLDGLVALEVEPPGQGVPQHDVLGCIVLVYLLLVVVHHLQEGVVLLQNKPSRFHCR